MTWAAILYLMRDGNFKWTLLSKKFKMITKNQDKEGNYFLLKTFVSFI